MTWKHLVSKIRQAASARGRRQLECYSIEGLRLAERALNLKIPIQSALVSNSLWASEKTREQKLLSRLVSSDCECVVAPDEAVNELISGRTFGAILGLVPSPVQNSLKNILKSLRSRWSCVLVGVEVADPGNVGALIRTALASEARAYISVGGTEPFHPKTVRTSMGAIFEIPIIRISRDKLNNLHQLCRQLGIEQVGTVAGEGTVVGESIMLSNAQLGERPAAVYMGSEAHGLSDDVCIEMDKLVTIPMGDNIDSFSINAAAAVVLYELGRRSWMRDRILF